MATVPKDMNEEGREFYRERLREAFSISGMVCGREAEEIVDTPEFGRMVGEYGIGSLDSARRVGDMAVIHLDKIVSTGPAGTPAGQDPHLPKAGRCGAPSEQCRPGEWWRDLLSYGRGQFLQLATTQPAPPWNRPRRGVSATCVNFGWNMPEVTKRLKLGQPITDELRRPMTLLFTRSTEGKVTVIEAGAAVEKVFRATNSMRTTPQIAETAGMSLADTERILVALAGVGAVIPAKNASEMLEAIQAKENRKA
jgi:hypothetical protein